MEATDLLPMDGDVAKITRRAEEFRDLPEAVQRNLQVFLTLTMDSLASAHQKVKTSANPESLRQMVSNMCFMPAKNAKWSADSGHASQKITVNYDFCRYSQIPNVSRCVFVPCATGCGDCSVVCIFPFSCVYFMTVI